MLTVIKMLAAEAQRARTDIETLYAEVAALRVLVGGALVDNAGALRYLETVAPNIDDLTIPFAMDDAQREIVRERVTKTLELVKVQAASAQSATKSNN